MIFKHCLKTAGHLLLTRITLHGVQVNMLDSSCLQFQFQCWLSGKPTGQSHAFSLYSHELDNFISDPKTVQLNRQPVNLVYLAELQKWLQSCSHDKAAAVAVLWHFHSVLSEWTPNLRTWKCTWVTLTARVSLCVLQSRVGVIGGETWEGNWRVVAAVRRCWSYSKRTKTNK